MTAADKFEKQFELRCKYDVLNVNAMAEDSFIHCCQWW